MNNCQEVVRAAIGVPEARPSGILINHVRLKIDTEKEEKPRSHGCRAEKEGTLRGKEALGWHMGRRRLSSSHLDSAARGRPLFSQLGSFILVCEIYFSSKTRERLSALVSM